MLMPMYRPLYPSAALESAFFDAWQQEIIPDPDDEYGIIVRNPPSDPLPPSHAYDQLKAQLLEVLRENGHDDEWLATLLADSVWIDALGNPGSVRTPEAR